MSLVRHPTERSKQSFTSETFISLISVKGDYIKLKISQSKHVYPKKILINNLDNSSAKRISLVRTIT